MSRLCLGALAGGFHILAALPRRMASFKTLPEGFLDELCSLHKRVMSAMYSNRSMGQSNTSNPQSRPVGVLVKFRAVLTCSELRSGIRDDVVALIMSNLAGCELWTVSSGKEKMLPCKTLLEKSPLSSIRATLLHNLNCCFQMRFKLQAAAGT